MHQFMNRLHLQIKPNFKVPTIPGRIPRFAQCFNESDIKHGNGHDDGGDRDGRRHHHGDLHHQSFRGHRHDDLRRHDRQSD